jgi:hypothetical protein
MARLAIDEMPAQSPFDAEDVLEHREAGHHPQRWYADIP